MIEREEIRFVAAADYTDDCRVTLELRKRRVTLTTTEAKRLIIELDAAIREAERGLADLLRPAGTAGFDVAVSPDCRDGKHRACVGDAWDVAADVPVACACACHWETITEEKAA